MFLGEVWVPGLDPSVSYGPGASPAEIALAEARAQPVAPISWTAVAVAAVALFVFLGTRKR